MNAQHRTYLLPNFPEAHWPWEQRVGDDVELVAMPQPPLSGVSDLHRRRLHVLIPLAPPGEPATCVVPEAQPNLETERCARTNQGQNTQSIRLRLETHDYDVPARPHITSNPRHPRLPRSNMMPHQATVVYLTLIFRYEKPCVSGGSCASC